MDPSPLGALLRSRGIFHCDTRLDGSTAVDLPALPGSVMYHLVLHGTCVVICDDTTVTLGEGEIVLVPHGTGHRIAAHGTPLWTVGLAESGRVDLGGGIEQLDLGGRDPALHLVCGAIALEHPASPRLPARLPPLLRAAAEGEDVAALRAVAALVLREAQEQAEGWAQVSAHLVEGLALREVRRAVREAPTEAGWWAASRDDAIGPVLGAVLANLAHPWGVTGMSRVAGLSRSAFSARFTALTGEAPMAWVTRVRMAEAHRLLREGSGVAAVARATGYGSEVSFRRAFRRETGIPPGRVRAHPGTPQWS